MQDFTWRGLLRSNFDKVMLAALFVAAGATIVILAHWNVSQEIVIRIEDAFSGILGALIALVTNNHNDGAHGPVIKTKTEGGHE
ncbi:MAG: hypothetical protein LAP85_14920 [Acidobacteriia bacterium]|nr:hypothetical protein [Terriglobia bacterium]